ncbi:MAG: HlyD family secretion protein [Stenotrophomonas acidaminiphila]
MPDGLFRTQVQLARQTSWLGSIALRSPKAGWWLLGIGLIFLLAMIVLLFLGSYTRREQVSGVLAPKGGLLSVVTSSPGVVAKILVREGDSVRSGDPLLEISGELSSAALGDTHAAVGSQLEFKRSRLQEDLDHQREQAELLEQDLRSRAKLLQAQISKLNERIAIQNEVTESAEQRYEQWSAVIESGAISKIQVLQQKDALLASRSQLRELEGLKLQLQEQSERLQSQIIQVPMGASVRLGDIERQLADVSQALVQNAAQEAFILRAPKDGIVGNLFVSNGQAVSAQQVLASVVPDRSELRAELWVPNASIGFMRVGDPVLIRYKAFPYQKYGSYAGRIEEISQSTVSSTELSRQLGLKIEESSFRVVAALDSQAIPVEGGHRPLRPGMALDADVVLDRRRLVEWVAEPIMGYYKKSNGSTPMKGSE